MTVAHATVEFGEACLAGDILLVLQNVLLIKQAAHTQETGLSRIVVTRFFAQEVSAEQFATETLATVSNFKGVR